MKRALRISRERRLCLFAAICGLILLVSVCLPLKTSARIYSSLLRFHVVANSDSGADQETKEALRDAVLDWTEDGLCACQSVTQAQAYLEENREVLQQKIRAFLSERGANYGAKITIANEYHPAKTYDEITLPQGVYLSFRITLGEGAGHNFFCVLFPPICRNSAKDRTNGEVLLDYGFSNRELNVLKDGGQTRYRFFFYDLLRGIFADE